MTHNIYALYNFDPIDINELKAAANNNAAKLSENLLSKINDLNLTNEKYKDVMFDSDEVKKLKEFASEVCTTKISSSSGSYLISDKLQIDLEAKVYSLPVIKKLNEYIDSGINNERDTVTTWFRSMKNSLYSSSNFIPMIKSWIKCCGDASLSGVNFTFIREMIAERYKHLQELKDGRDLTSIESLGKDFKRLEFNIKSQKKALEKTNTQLKSTNNNLLRQQYIIKEELSNKLKSTENALKATLAQNNLLQDQVKKLKSEKLGLQQQLQSALTKINDLQDQIKTIKSQKNELSNKVNKLESGISERDKQIEQLINEKSALDRKVSHLNGENQRLLGELADVTTNLKSENSENIIRLQTDLIRISSDLAKVNKENAYAIAKKDDLSNQVNKLKLEKSELGKQFAFATKEISEKNVQIKSLQEELKSEQESKTEFVAGLSMEISQLKANLGRRNAQNEQILEEKNKLSKRLQEVSQTNASLYSENVRLNQQNMSLKYELNYYTWQPLGLGKLDKNPFPAREVENSPQDLSATCVVINQKKLGVEPGWLVVDPASIKAANETYKNNYVQAQQKYRTYDPIELAEDLLSKEPKNPWLMALDISLLKQDYMDPVKGKRLVGPSEEDVERTNAIKNNAVAKKSNAFKWLMCKGYSTFRQKDLNIENINAVFEVMATDIARAYGMKVQEQYLRFGTYSAGHLKILTQANWIHGFETLPKPKGGGAQQGNLLTKEVDGKLKSMRLPGGMAAQYAMILLQGDCDAFGSTCSNKGLVDGGFVGIDFGHAFRGGENPIIDSVRTDFSFKYPDTSSFKHYSVFSDVKRSELMKGIHLLNRLAYGKNIAAEVWNSFSNDQLFVDQFNAIITGQHLLTVSRYKEKFEQLQSQAPDDQKNDYKEIMEKIQETKAYIESSQNKLLDTFADYMNLTSNEIDLLENIEKLTSIVKLKSPDGKVMRNHLFIIPESRVEWEMKKIDNYYSISFKQQHTSKGLTNEVTKETIDLIEGFIKKNSHSKDLVIFDRQKCAINFHMGKFNEVLNIFNEKDIVSYLFKAEKLGIDHIEYADYVNNYDYAQGNIQNNGRPLCSNGYTVGFWGNGNYSMEPSAPPLENSGNELDL